MDWYRNIVAVIGSEKLLVGAPVASGGAGEGYITLINMTEHVIKPLQANYGVQFGGMMGCEFALDRGGHWGKGIGAALGVPLASPGQSYTIVAGDTLFAIAQRFLGNGSEARPHPFLQASLEFSE